MVPESRLTPHFVACLGIEFFGTLWAFICRLEGLAWQNPKNTGSALVLDHPSSNVDATASQ